MVKSSKKVVKAASGNLIMPELNPRDTDVKYTGGEPVFNAQPGAEIRTGALVKAFNWYSRFFDRKTAKEQFAVYAEYNGDKDTARLLRKVDEKAINPSIGWLARLSMRGLDLTEQEKITVSSEITRMLKIKVAAKEVEAPKEQPKVNVQEIMRERAREAAGELEGLLDDFIKDGAKSANAAANVVGVLSERNVLPQHIPGIAAVWKLKAAEYQEALDGGDKQLVEAYSHYTKHQLKAVLKFIDAVLAGLDSYINVKKISKAPRKRKAVSPEKQTAKIKFLKQYPELGLTSVHPAKILGSTEVWAYDTAKRKLHYYVADSHVGTLGVKGATILGFDAVKSGVKTLRKPQEALKKLLSAGKPASRKLFEEIKSVQARPNGRTNEHLLFLKVY